MKTNRLIRISTASAGFALMALLASSAAPLRPLVQPLAPPTAPVLHYAMDDVDPTELNLGSTGAANNGEYIGTTRDTVDVANIDIANQASRFVPTNTSERLRVIDVTSFPESAISCSFWVKTSATNAGTPFSYAADTGSNNEFQVYDTRNLRVYVRGSNQATGVSVNDGEWHHIVATWTNVGGEVRLYKDGFLEYSGSALQDGNLIRLDGTLTIGQEQDIEDGNFSNWQALRGNIDDVRFYDYVLTQENAMFLANNVDPPGITTNNNPTFFLPDGSPIDFTFDPGVAPYGDVPGDEIYYTTDGSNPEQAYPPANAQLYNGSVNLNAVGPRVVVKARAYDSTGTLGPSRVMTWYFSESYQPTQASQGILIPGIYSKYYTGTGPWLPFFPALIPEQRTLEQDFNLGTRTQNTDFGYEFEGFLRIGAGEEGIYHFDTISDDGSKLFISDDGTNGEIEIVDNDGPHGRRRRTGFLWLNPGYYAIRVPFSQGTGGFSLDVEWRGPATGDVRIALENDQINPDRLYSTPLVATPTITPGTGTYVATVDATLASATAGALIYYTCNGDAPDQRAFKNGGITGDPVVVTLTQETKLRVIAYDPNNVLLPSTIVEADYSFVPDGYPQLISVNSTGSTTEVEVVFDRLVDPTSAIDASNYVIDNGIGNPTAPGVLQADGKTVLFTTSTLTAGTTYTLTVTGVLNQAQNSAIPVPGASGTFQLSQTGSILREWWEGISGSNVSSLTSSPDYPDNPTGNNPFGQQGTDFPLNFQHEDPGNLGTPIVNWLDNYGSRYRGYFIPDQTGNWYFRIATDDNSELYLSTDSTPANKALISQVTAWTSSRAYNDPDVVPSPAIFLEAGKRYYIESLMKEGGGGDSLAVRAQYEDPNFTDGDPPIAADGVGTEPNTEGGMLAPFLGGGTVTNPGPPTLVSVTPINSTTVRVVFDRDVDSSGLVDTNYTLVDDNLAPVSVTIDPDPMVNPIPGSTIDLTTAALSPNTVYTLTVSGVSDSTGNNANSGETKSFAFADSGITREWWLGISGGRVSNLTGNPAFPDNPTGNQIESSFQAPVQFADNYGTRMHGYFIPDTDGMWVFAIASDDNSELWLSTDEDPANKTRIAWVNSWTSQNDFLDVSTVGDELVASGPTVPAGPHSLSRSPIVPNTLELWAGAIGTGTQLTVNTDYTEDLALGEVTLLGPGQTLVDNATPAELHATFTWREEPNQQSLDAVGAIQLLAGERYYIEALQKEGGGGDNLAVAAKINDNTTIPSGTADPLSPIPAVGAGSHIFLQPFGGVQLVQIVKQPEDRFVVAGSDVTFEVQAVGTGPITYEWYRDGQLFSFGTTPTLQLFNVDLSDMAAYHVVVHQQSYGYSVQSQTANLWINDSTPPQLVDVAATAVPGTGPGTGLIKIIVVFDELLYEPAAASPLNYEVVDSDFPGTPLTVSNAALSSDGMTVELTMQQPLCNGIEYTLTVNPAGALTPIEDLSVPPNVMGTDFRVFTPTGKPSLGLALHWAFDEGMGDTTADSTMNGFDGTLLEVVQDGTPPGWSTGGDAINRNAIRFDGDQVGNVGHLVEGAADVSEDGYTSSFWFKTSEGNQGIFSLPFGSNPVIAWDREVYLDNGDLVARTFASPQCQDEKITTVGTNWADGDWHHVVHVMGGVQGGQQLYVDGVQQNITIDPAPLNPEPDRGTGTGSCFGTTHIRIGDWTNAVQDYFNGWVDDVRVYNRALTDQEITDLSNPNFPPVVSAGPDFTIPIGVPVPMIATADDYDFPAQTLTVQWSTLTQPGGSTVTFGDATVAGTTLMLDTVGQYVLHLEADDGELSSCDRVVVNAVVSTTPEVNFIGAASSGLEPQVTTDALIDISLSVASDQVVTVDYSFTEIEAFNGTDFTGTPGSVQFQPGEVIQTISVPILPDTDVEGPHRFEVNIDNVSGGGASVGTVQTVHEYTIIDDDSPPAVQFTLASSSVSEGITGGGPANVEISLAWAFGSNTTITFSILPASTATGGGTDYSIAQLTAFIPMGTQTVNVPVTIADDFLDENNETVVLQIDSTDNAVSIAGNTQHTLTILDDEPTLLVQFVDTFISNSETLVSPVVQVELVDPLFPLPTASGRTVTVDYVVTGGTAIGNNVDYLLDAGTLTFDETIGEDTKTLPLVIVNDALPETIETIIVTLTNAQNAIISGGTLTYEIADDDSPGIVGFDSSSSADTEDVANVNLSVSLSQPDGNPITVDYTVLGTSTADSPEDYAILGTGVLTFDPGVTQQDIQLTIVDDPLVEVPDETIIVELSNPTPNTVQLGTTTHTYTIINNDFAPALTIADAANVTELDPLDPGADPLVTFDVTLLPLPASTDPAVIVTFALADGTAIDGDDYDSSTVNTLTLTWDDMSSPTQQITVNVLSDLLNETNENFFLNMVAITQGTATVSDGSGSATILDDDPLPTITLTQITPASPLVTEGNTGTAPPTTVTYEATLDAPSGRAVTANVTLTPSGTNPASAGSDYISPASPPSISIPALSTTAQFTVDIVGDTVGELNETFDVSLTSISNATAGTVQTTTTIVNDDDSTFQISTVTPVPPEGNNGLVTPNQVTIQIDLFPPPASGQSATVEVFTQDVTAVSAGNEDYVAVPVTVLNFTDVVTSQQITIDLNGDTMDEPNETFNVILQNAVGTNMNVNLTGVSPELVTIVDDDATPVINLVQVTNAGGPVPEGNSGPTTVTYEVSLANTTYYQDITVTITTNPSGANPATQIDDYDPNANPAQVVIPAGTSGPVQFTIDIVGETDAEPDETFQVVLSSFPGATGTGGTTTVTTTIENDDLPGIQISDVTVIEADTTSVNAVFTISLTATSPTPITVFWATQDDSAISPDDFAAQGATQVTIPPNTPSITVTVVVAGDLLVEGTEQFFVNLTNESANSVIIDPQGVGTITDNDLPGVSIDDVSQPEGTASNSTFMFTVSIDQVSTQDVVVNWSTQDDTALQAEPDYTAASGQVTIPAGSLTASTTIDITVIGDSTGELDETFFVNLTSATNANIADNRGVGTIENDDLPSLSIADVQVLEGDNGTTNAVFTVVVSGLNLVDIDVDYATSNGTATAGVDYQSTSGTLTISANSPSGQIIVPIFTDTVDEVDMTFTLTLGNEQNATLTNNTAIGTILDDDGPDITIDDLSQPEGTGTTVDFDFTVNLSASSVQDVTIDFITMDGSAQDGSDYTGISAGQLIIPAGDTTGTITVVVNSDAVDEPDETFTVELVTATGGTITDTSAVGTIENDDDLFIVTGSTLPSGTEGAFYQTQVVAGGGVQPYVWSLEPGSDTPSFPFALDPNTGIISGIAPVNNATTIYTFDLRVTDAQAPAEFVIQTFTITIDPGAVGNPVIDTTVLPPDGTVGVAYSFTFSASGGQPPYTWSVLGGQGNLPSGLSLNTTTGELSGTPDTIQSNVTFTIVVTDSTTPTAGTGQQAFTVDINPNPVTITTTSLPDGQVGVAYSQTVTATGGIGPYIWRLLPGGTSPPTGLSISGTGLTATISGIPQTPGNYDFIVEIEDTGQGTPVTDTQVFTLTIAASGAGTLTITTTSLPSGTEGQAYPGVTLTATGGTPPYTWTVTGLPASMTYDSATGVISGTPDPGSAGAYSIDIQVSDAGTPAQNDSVTLSLTIFSLPTITTPGTLPTATLNVAYSTQLNATGGVTPYTWSIQGGTLTGDNWSGGGLPAGLSLNRISGLISGIPTSAVAGAVFTVDVTDSNSGVGSQVFDLTVVDPSTGLQIITTTLPRGTAGTPYSTQLQAVGGTPANYMWSLSVTSPDALPAWLNLDAATGVLSSSSPVATTLDLIFELTDGGAPVTSGTLTLIIDPVLTVTTTSLPGGALNILYGATLNSSGAVGGTTWSIIGSLPAGLSLTPTTGQITGTPTAVTVATFNVQVQDSLGRTAQRQLTITITAVPVSAGSSNDRDCSVATVARGGAAATGGRGILWVLMFSGLMLLAFRRRA